MFKVKMECKEFILPKSTISEIILSDKTIKDDIFTMTDKKLKLIKN